METDKKYLGHNIFFNEAILHHNISFVCAYTINILARPMSGIKRIYRKIILPMIFTCKYFLKTSRSILWGLRELQLQSKYHLIIPDLLSQEL